MSENREPTEEIISFLQQPSSYSHHPAEIKIVQTHASVLAMAPPYVFKLKKHIDLGFMKFTTLQERKRNCERELQLNSRFCAGLYIAVLPIATRNGHLFFGADGEIVEYALQMHLLPDGYFTDQLLQAGKLTTGMLDAVLAVLKNFYTKHRSGVSVSAYGDIEIIRKTTDDNLATLEEHAGEVVHPASIQTIGYFLHSFLARHEALFRKRVQELRIQDCHGDLHLDHIHIQGEKICIFDCIEFNDQFRFIDVATDIAFLAMDLDFHERPDLAVYIADRMAELLQDPDMKLLMDYYKCTRACVRAKVDYIRALEAEVPAAERRLSCERVSRYISLALRYTLFGSRPTVLIVFGNVGSGKTTVAKNLARLLNCKNLSSDSIRKGKAGIPLFRRTDPERRARLYSKEVSDEVYQELLREALAYAAKFQYLVLDATFGSSSRRADFIQALEQQQVNYYFLEVYTSDEIIKARLAQRELGEQVVSDARLEDFEMLRQSYQKPDDIPPQRLLRLNTSIEINELLQQVLSELAQRGAALPVTEV